MGRRCRCGWVVVSSPPTRLTLTPPPHPTSSPHLLTPPPHPTPAALKSMKLPKGGKIGEGNPRNMQQQIEQMSRMLPPHMLKQMGGPAALQVRGGVLVGRCGRAGRAAGCTRALTHLRHAPHCAPPPPLPSSEHDEEARGQVLSSIVGGEGPWQPPPPRPSSHFDAPAAPPSVLPLLVLPRCPLCALLALSPPPLLLPLAHIPNVTLRKLITRAPNTIDHTPTHPQPRRSRLSARVARPPSSASGDCITSCCCCC